LESLRVELLHHPILVKMFTTLLGASQIPAKVDTVTDPKAPFVSSHRFRLDRQIKAIMGTDWLFFLSHIEDCYLAVSLDHYQFRCLATTLEAPECSSFRNTAGCRSDKFYFSSLRS
jgi:hypothetical protein